MIHDELVTCEVAKLAKEKGFPLQKVIKQDGRAFFYELPQSHPDWANCDAWYLPTQSLLQRWLREEKGIIILVNIGYCYENEDIPFYMNPNMEPIFNGYYYGIWRLSELNNSLTHSKYFPTYELALEDALKYTLENLI